MKLQSQEHIQKTTKNKLVTINISFSIINRKTLHARPFKSFKKGNEVPVTVRESKKTNNNLKLIFYLITLIWSNLFNTNKLNLFVINKDPVTTEGIHKYTY